MMKKSGKGEQTGMKERYLLGIDGGGTKTRFVLTNPCGIPLRFYDGKSSNPSDIGLDGMEKVLADGIGRVTEGIGQEKIVSVFAGLAGAGARKNEALSCLKTFFSPQTAVSVGTDAVNMLSCAHSDGDGGLIIAGTGSGCFVRTNGEIFMVGGWGYLIDDGGSGFAVGRDGLNAVFRAVDGRGEKTLLCATFSEALGYDASGAVPEVYSKGKPFIASLAPAVFRAAEAGDPIAQKILSENAAKLAELAVTAGKRAGKDLSFACGGGMFEHHPEYLNAVRNGLPDGIALFPLPADPVFGAVSEAAKSVGIRLGEEERAAFQKEFTSLRS